VHSTLKNNVPVSAACYGIVDCPMRGKEIEMGRQAARFSPHETRLLGWWRGGRRWIISALLYGQHAVPAAGDPAKVHEKRRLAPCPFFLSLNFLAVTSVDLFRSASEVQNNQISERSRV